MSEKTFVKTARVVRFRHVTTRFSCSSAEKLDFRHLRACRGQKQRFYKEKSATCLNFRKIENWLMSAIFTTPHTRNGCQKKTFYRKVSTVLTFENVLIF